MDLQKQFYGLTFAPTIASLHHALMNHNEEQIKNLCRMVEETSGMTIAKSKDFEHLALAIYDRTGTLLSPTTLKRIWGYLKETTATRMSTLDLLAQYCGWYTFNDFLKGNRPDIESGFIGAKVLNAESDLKPGNVIRLMWHPSRICDIKYLGECRWVVQRSEGTRLIPGDTFRCSVIMAGEPLYIDDLVHDGSQCGVYVCGRRSGVRFVMETTN